MFLSRLNEMGGGREYMCLVSGSLRTFLRMTIFMRDRSKKGHTLES